MKTEKQTGSVDIELSKPLTIDGTTVKALRMREPTVADQLAMAKQGGDPAEQELALVAALCMVKPTDLHQLTMRDYKKVQAALVDFTV